MRYYPVHLDIQNRNCLVVGGGSVGTRKVITLLDCGAKVTVISPVVSPLLREFATSGSIKLSERRYRSGDLDGMFLVIGATEADPNGNRSAGESYVVFGRRHDPDGDGNESGLENFFGTDPSAFTGGLTAGMLDSAERAHKAGKWKQAATLYRNVIDEDHAKQTAADGPGVILGATISGHSRNWRWPFSTGRIPFSGSM